MSPDTPAIRKLIDERDKAKAEIIAMREIVEAVASLAVEDDDEQPFYMLWSEEHYRDRQWFEGLVTKARALLGKSPA